MAMNKPRQPRAVDMEFIMFYAMLMMMMVRQSVQLKSNHPLHGIVDAVNRNGGGPYIGLVMAFSTEEIALQASGFFSPSQDFPLVQLAGRTYNIGSIMGVSVIYVMSGEKTILLDVFDIRGVVHYGIAGSSNDSLVIGDVSVPDFVAFTSSWKWMGYKSTEKSNLPELAFGAYNVPNEGENLLAKVEFELEQLYSVGKPVEEVFWLPLDNEWLSIATQLKDLKLQQCVNETYCLPETPKLIYGLKGSSADVFLDNAAYRSFLFNKFNISTVDEESAAVTMTCLSNGVPCIVFRGVSDMAGGGGTSVSLTSLAAINAVNAAAHFIGLLDKESSSRDL